MEIDLPTEAETQAVEDLLRSLPGLDNLNQAVKSAGAGSLETNRSLMGLVAATAHTNYLLALLIVRLTPKGHVN